MGAFNKSCADIFLQCGGEKNICPAARERKDASGADRNDGCTQEPGDSLFFKVEVATLHNPVYIHIYSNYGQVH